MDHPAPPAADAPLLEARDLVKHYPKVKAVDGVSLALRPGTCFGLLGPNGAGKTTTIEMLEGISPPTSGQVLYRGEPLGARFRQEAGIQFQKTSLQEFLTVRETVELFHGLYEHTLPIDEVMKLCALEELADRDNRKLSGGQQQRLLLAVALVNDPAVLFLDEPTTGMDPQARRSFWDLIQGIKARGTTVLLTTHYMDEAYVLCDRIAIMDRGRIITEGSPTDLLREHFDDVVLEVPAADVPAALREALATTGAGALGVPNAQVNLRDDLVEVSTGSVEATLQALTAKGASLRGLRIRPRNLEDLFLELTGREMRA